MRLRYLFVASIGLALGLLILVFWRSPRISSWVPATNELRANQTIALVTNMPISSESVSSHFQITPHVSGTLQVNGTKILFDPAEPLEYGRSYTITLSPGLKGENGLISLSGYQQSYMVSEPEMLFMRQINGLANLWRQDESGDTIQLTDEPNGIWDYDVLPDGSGVLVSSLDSDGSDDLVAIMSSGGRNVLLDCQEHRCRSGHRQPNGSLIAFERSDIDESGDSTEVWLLDSTSGSLWPAHKVTLFADEGFGDAFSRYPRWSSDGRYLSYYKPDARAIVALDLHGGQPQIIPANVDAMGDWAPSKYQLSFTELILNETHDDTSDDQDDGIDKANNPSLKTRVLVADIGASSVLDLSQGSAFKYGVPEWHPDGGLIATGGASNGLQQIWMLPLDGGEPVELTDAPSFRHTSPSWSPDGRRLAFMRSGIEASDGSAGVWIVDLDGGEPVLVAEDAFIPGWLP
ncbi:MAG: Ig-like domain-containing protein [Candidatus Promineifilaceae bacterium]